MSMSMEYPELRAQVCEYAKRMHATGMVVGTAGNVSARIFGEARVAITPSSLAYADMTPEDVQVVDLDGNQVTNGRPPSFELGVHLGVYRAREDVGAVFHTHATFSSILASLRRPLPPVIEELVPYVGGQVEVADYAMSASPDLAANVVRALGERSAVFLANHGNLCCGKDLARAYKNAELVERVAQIYVLGSLLGRPISLPNEIVESEKLVYDTMRKYG
jgi:L-fuculose-phosphate aldolase